MNVYREPSPLPLELAEPPKRRGLVRWNGASCTCKPPGRLWCWWFDVDIYDKWICEHDREWVRDSNLSAPPFLERYWRSTPTKGKEP